MLGGKYVVLVVFLFFGQLADSELEQCCSRSQQQLLQLTATIDSDRCQPVDLTADAEDRGPRGVVVFETCPRVPQPFGAYVTRGSQPIVDVCTRTCVMIDLLSYARQSTSRRRHFRSCYCDADRVSQTSRRRRRLPDGVGIACKYFWI